MNTKESSTESAFDIRTLSLYEPLKIQSSKLMVPLIYYLLFGIVQGIRSDKFGWGFVERWFGSRAASENDYGLIVACSLIGFVGLASNALSTTWHRDQKAAFFLGAFDFLPTVTNLVLMLFLFYLMAYRGLWSFSELRHGFTWLPFLKVFLFTYTGFYGYRAFCHLFEMRRLAEAGKAEDLIYYIATHRLDQFR